MSPQDLRNKIEQILRNPQACHPEEFIEVATVYANLTQNLNRRLTMCNRWIDQGLRCEAIHMASLEPDILDSLGAVDLGEATEDWASLCKANNAPVAERANWEQASYLNEAWDMEERLAPLLRNLRSAILRKASIAQRIGILRSLLELDPNNLAWDTMARELEQLRVLELERELEDASQRNDLKKLKALEAEVHSADWREPPPLELLSESVAERRKAKQVRVRQQYSKLAKHLHTAMYEGDPAEAARLRSNWDQLEEIARISPPTEAADEAGVVFSWLDELNEQKERDSAYTTACDLLNTMLDANADMGELEKAYFQLSQFDMGIPPLLETRYAARVQEAERSRKVKLATLAIASIAAITAIAIFTTLYIRNANYTDRRDEFQASIDQAIIDKNFVVLEELVQTGPTNFPNQFAEQLSVARTMLKADEARAKRFKELYAQLASKQSNGTLLEVSNSSIEKLAELARIEDEVERSDALQFAWSEARNRQAAAQLSILRKTFESARLELKDVTAAINSESPETLLDDCRALQETIRNLRTDLLAVEGSSQLASQVDAFSSSVRDTMTRIRDRKEQMDAAVALYDKIRRHHDTPNAYLETLRSLQASAIPQEHKMQLERTLQSARLLGHIEAWNAIARTLPQNLIALHRRESPDATNRTQVLSRELASLPADRTLFGTDLTPLQAFVDSARYTQSPDDGPEQVLDSFLSRDRPWATPKLNRLVTKQGNYYAISPDARLEENKQGNMDWMLWGAVSSSEDIENHNPGLLAISPELLPDGFDVSAPMSKSGVSQWLQQAKRSKRLSSPPTNNPLLWYIELLGMLLAIDDMEPTVRLALAARLADMHQRRGWPAIPELQELASYATMEPPSNWPNPTAELEERTVAKEHLLGLDSTSIERWKKAVDNAMQELQTARPHELAFAGCIWLDEQGTRKIYLYNNANRSGEMLTLVRSGNGTLTLNPIAQRNAGILTYGSEGSAHHEAFHKASLGMPVFMKIGN